ncbi:MAG: hypothetical protein A2020_01205 [Lentisphaerae bacterium GWF2_45_14]|nr:MAG: hypothetical protein A2020_01205 [Lentisphaerae bacterium GWF2_45_14]
MNELAGVIRHQIENCKNLLCVFQDERKTYQEKRQLGTRDVMEILKKKKQIFDVFEQQHALLKEIGEAPDNEEVRAGKKELLSDLSAVIEQVLVIDHENEKLLREQMSSRSAISSNSASFSRERPALQRQLPFVPGQNAFRIMAAKPTAVEVLAKPSIPETAQPKQPESVRFPVLSAATLSTTDVIRARPKSQLRNYAQAAQILQFSPKYA